MDKAYVSTKELAKLKVDIHRALFMSFATKETENRFNCHNKTPFGDLFMSNKLLWL
jgi:hypothetical protein